MTSILLSHFVDSKRLLETNAHLLMWDDEHGPPPPGHKMMFNNVVDVVSRYFLLKLLLLDRLLRWAPMRMLEIIRDDFDEFYVSI
jgi:hypothetical protein